MNNIV